MKAAPQWYNASCFAVPGEAGEQNGTKSKYNIRSADIIPRTSTEYNGPAGKYMACPAWSQKRSRVHARLLFGFPAFYRPSVSAPRGREGDRPPDAVKGRS